MAGGTGTVTVKVIGDADQFKKTIDDVNTHTSKLGSGFATLGKIAAGAFAGAAVAGVAFAKSALDAAAESQKVAAQTDAVIKSTGAAAGVTSKYVGDLAHSLQNLSGVSDENIQTGQNMLLTFTGIRDEAGKGRDIFTQATKTMLDMSVATGTDAKNSALQLGKALNDPIKGVGALSRVGVTFTEQQKASIKAMQQHGDMAGAQSVILAELSKEFGGSAAAAGAAMTPMERLSMKFGDLQENVGTMLLPVIDKAVTLFEQYLPKAMAMAGDAVETVRGIVEKFVGFFKGSSDDTSATASRFGEILTSLKETFSSVFEAVKAIVDTSIKIISEAWDRFGRGLIDNVKRAFDAVAQVFDGALKVLSGVMDLVKAVLTGKWGDAWEAIKKIVSGAWEAIRGLVKLGVEQVRVAIETAMGVVSGVWSAAWDGVKTLLSDAWAGIRKVVASGFDGLLGFFTDMPSRIAGAASGMWRGVTDSFKAAINTIIRMWNDLHLTIGGQHVGLPFGLGFDIPTITLNTPNIPTFEHGGIVPGPVGAPMLAVVHGGEEFSGVGRRLDRRGDVNITVMVSGVVGDDRAVIEKIRRGLVDVARSNGDALGGLA